MNGKDKCRILKQIRREIAEKNDIEWVVSECKHKGNCKGTCPKCEAEVRKLEAELSLRRRLGKTVAIVGASTLCTAGLTACSLTDTAPFSYISDLINPTTTPYVEELDGEIESYYPEDETTYKDDGTDGGEDIEPTDDWVELSGDVPAY